MKKDLEECNCSCHSNPGTRHIVTCCYSCPKCGKRIVTYSFDVHVKNCKG